MNQKTKNLILLLGAVFVAIIFLSSYLSFNNNNAASTSTSTIKNVQTVYASGAANGIISNYSGIVYITSNYTNSTKSDVANALLNLQSSGAVQSYVYLNNTFQVILGNVSAYTFQQTLYNNTGLGNSIGVGSTTYVTLPSSITLYYANTPVSIYLPKGNYSVYMSNVRQIGTKVSFGVGALITSNGSVYDGQLRLFYNG